MVRILYPITVKPVSTAKETVSVDRWLQPLALPVWSKVLPIAVVAAGMAQTMVPARAENVSVDRWLEPLTLPVRVAPGLGAASQAAFFSPISEARETVTVDRWLEPLSQPVWAKPGLQAGLQSSSVAPLVPIVSAVSIGWHQPLSLPVRLPGGVTAADQSTLTEPVSEAPETVTEDRWHQPLSLPVWAKPGLSAANHTRPVGPVSLSPETVSVDRWWQPFTLPVWSRAALSAAAQSAFASPLSEAPEAVTVDRWGQPLSQPLFPRTMAAALQYSFAWGVFAASTPEVVTEDKWHQPFATVTRAVSSVAAVPSVVAPVSIAPETTTADRWWKDLSQPYLQRSMPAWLQPSAFVPPFVELLTEDKWHQPFSQPYPARIGLGAAQQLAGVGPVSIAPETVSVDRWWQPLANPVWSRTFGAAQQLASFWNVSTPAPPLDVISAGWWVDLSVPVRPGGLVAPLRSEATVLPLILPGPNPPPDVIVPVSVPGPSDRLSPAEIERRKWLEWAAGRRKRSAEATAKITQPAAKAAVVAPPAVAPQPVKLEGLDATAALLSANLAAARAQAEGLIEAARVAALVEEARRRAQQDADDDDDDAITALLGDL